MASSSEHAPLLPGSLRARLEVWLLGLLGWALLALCVAVAASLLTWSAADPSLTRTTSGVTRNALGPVGASFADLAMRLLGLAAVFMVLPLVFWGLQLITRRQLEDARLQLMLASPAVLLLACAASALPSIGAWPLPYGLGGFLGDQTLRFVGRLLGAATPAYATPAAGILCLVAGSMLLIASLGMSLRDVWLVCRVGWPPFQTVADTWRLLARAGERPEPVYARREPTFESSAEPRAGRRQLPFSVEPAFDFEPPVRRTGHRVPAPPGKSVHLRRPIERDPEFDRATDAASLEMARRFAPPAREEPSGPPGLGLFRRRWAQPGGIGQRRPPAAGERRQQERRPVWPGSVPVPTGEDATPAEPYSHGDSSPSEGDYRRVLALMRVHGQVSATFLHQRHGIPLMRAAELIDRAEREGRVRAPVHGGRPIRGVPARPRIV
jgi:DNA translocase FtsK/SpoIIIE-like protein